MNRKTLFGRMASSLSAATPDRPEYLNLRLEPLEDRKLLAFDTFVSTSWVFQNSSQGPTLEAGDLVRSTGSGTIIFAVYGSNAFGTVSGLSIDQYATIHSAIQAAEAGSTVTLLAGTFKESDIVIDKPLTLQGRLNAGTKTALIVPEVASAAVQENFGAGTHSGIIIYSPSVTVKDLMINGSGNGALGAGLNFHHGITTLYDTQNGGAYSSIRHGSMPLIHLGTLNAPPVEDAGNRPFASVPVIDIDNVAISNVYWHGATISPLFNHNFDSGQDENWNLQIRNSTITNVGDVKDANRIGVLLQNLNDEKESMGNVSNTTITDAGIGIKTAPFGDNIGGSYGASHVSGNQSYIRNVTVNNPTVYGIAVYDGSRSDAPRWKVTHSNPANNAVGIYLNRSKAFVVGGTVTGLKTGIQIQNSPLSVSGGNNDRHPAIGYETYITGPGTGVAGSVGILVNTSVGDDHAANVVIGEEFTVTNFNVGLRAEQLNTPNVTPTPNVPIPGNKNLVLFGGGRIYGNGTDVVIGQNSVAAGAMQNAKSFAAMSVQVVGNGELDPRMFNYDFENPYFSDSPNDTNIAPNADAHTIGSVTFNSSSTFSALLTGDTGNRMLFDFNSFADYPFSEPPDAPVDGIVPDPYGALFDWFGDVTQDGNGQLTVSGDAFNGKQYEFLFGSRNTPIVDGPNAGKFQLVGTNLTGDSHVVLKVKLLATNQSKTFGFGLLDTRGNVNAWYMDATELSSTTYTDVVFNLLTPTVDLTGPQDNLDLSNIAGWLFGGDQGLANGLNNVPTRFTVDEVRTQSMANSQLNVTGTVNLAGAKFNGSLGGAFVPTVGQKYTIIENDGADAVVGTFAGQAEGSSLLIGGNKFTISYVGGTGNDVVLERVTNDPANPIPTVSSINRTTPAGPNTGPGSVAYTVTFSEAVTGVDATDFALALTGATTATTPVVVTGSGAVYTVTVNGITGVGTLGLNLVNDNTIKDSANQSITAGLTGQVYTITAVPPGDATVMGRHIFYNNSKFDGSTLGVDVLDDAAIATDKVAFQFSGSANAPVTAYTSYSRGINGIMIDIKTPAATPVLSDFTFKVGTNGTVSSWVNAPAPTAFSVRPGAGVGGTDRVEIIWADNAIQNSWLQVIVEGNDTLGGNNTHIGLAQSNTFFYGNRIGDTFVSAPAGSVTTTAADGLAARGNIGPNRPITNIYDFDRSRSVTAADELVSRANAGTLTRNLTWNPPAGPLAAQADDDSSGAIASALAAKSSASSPKIPGWISDRLASVDLNSGPVAKLFTALADANTPKTRALLQAANDVTDALDLDDSLLESLIAGLN